MEGGLPRFATEFIIRHCFFLRQAGYEKSSYVGSWNLHELMPRDLDFFIMLSSLAGILGNRGQSNYRAGNNLPRPTGPLTP